MRHILSAKHGGQSAIVNSYKELNQFRKPMLLNPAAERG
jgi:hypothetical protein